MKSKEKVGVFCLHASVDVPVNSRILAKIFQSIAKSVLEDGWSFLPSDSMDIKVRFLFNSEENN